MGFYSFFSWKGGVVKLLWGVMRLPGQGSFREEPHRVSDVYLGVPRSSDPSEMVEELNLRS